MKNKQNLSDFLSDFYKLSHFKKLCKTYFNYVIMGVSKKIMEAGNDF